MTYLAEQREKAISNAPCAACRGRGQVQVFGLRVWRAGERIDRKSYQTPPGGWHSATRFSQLAPRALTLIELLVVIVILVTLVAGVIPLVSPNNDARKIREASRGLQSYINATQAEAARTGRPHGIGFVESPSGDGMALEVFRMEVPLAFAGYSEWSTAFFSITDAANYRFQIQLGEGLGSSFIKGTGLDVPERLTRPGDMIEIGGARFLLEADGDVTQVNGIPYFNSKSNYANAILINSNRTSLTVDFPNEDPSSSGTFWSNPKAYKIIRQPVPSSASPFVFPAGIGIDLQGSVQEGGTTTGLPVPNSFATPRTTTGTNPQIIPDSVNIMFSPNGNVSSLIHNGNQVTSVSRVVLLLGRVENGGLSYEPNNASSSGDVTSGDWTMNTGDTNEQLAQKQLEINWLNPDSRLLGIAVRSGRAVVNEVAYVDARLFGDQEPAKQADEQIEAAHDIAHAMKRGGGR